MTCEVILPKWGLTMEEGTLTTWLAAEGETVAEGQVIAEVETDKVISQLEAPASGVLSKILVSAGTESIPVGTVLAYIE
jgi:pyruvate/2-oxoglutarate dehydrogenase complex dihydrolipoamide acyltransferase (E2) component